jgi:hypothetical protein
MRKAALTKMAAKVATTATAILALAVAAGASAPSADAATCVPGSGTAALTVNGTRYCYVGRTWDPSGNTFSDNYTTYVLNNGVGGSLIRVVTYWGGWYVYGCYRTNPGFSGWTDCPF